MMQLLPLRLPFVSWRYSARRHNVTPLIQQTNPFASQALDVLPLFLNNHNQKVDNLT
jgi:hypothetical protein